MLLYLNINVAVHNIKVNSKTHPNLNFFNLRHININTNTHHTSWDRDNRRKKFYNLVLCYDENYIVGLSLWWIHQDAERVKHPKRSWKLHTPSPYFVLYISSVWLFLNFKPVNVSDVFSWVFWDILTYYQTWRGGHGNPQFITNQSEVLLTNLGCATGTWSEYSFVGLSSKLEPDANSR